MAPIPKDSLVPGTRVRVTQQVAARDFCWTTQVEGDVVSFESSATGSWFAHTAGGRFVLDRLTLRKSDGEITTLNLDAQSLVELVGGRE